MDIITHTLSGLAVGTVAISYTNKDVKAKLGLLTLSAFAAALPDLDAISLWSGFDATIGRTFGLNNPGREIYFAKFWYSHHAFLHSLTAGILIGMLLFLIYHILKMNFSNASGWGAGDSFKSGKIYFVTFIVAFSVHLIEDMPTPSSVWGGVNLFWPSATYVGGTGDIWWWNNYDIFLIVLLVIFLNLSINILSTFIKIKSRLIATSFFALGIILITIQIKSRNYDFSYTGFTQEFQVMEAKSKEIQREILGENLYHLMESIDRKTPLNF